MATALIAALALGPVVLDGGLATQLEAQGHDLRTELWSARLLHDDPDAIANTRIYNNAGIVVEVTGPINLGNPEEFTIRQLAEAVLALTGSASHLVNQPLPEDDPMQRCPDIARAREVLGWEPSVQLDRGLQHTIAYFDTLLTERGKAL